MAAQFIRGRDSIVTMDIGHVQDMKEWLAGHDIEVKMHQN